MEQLNSILQNLLALWILSGVGGQARPFPSSDGGVSFPSDGWLEVQKAAVPIELRYCQVSILSRQNILEPG
jgi:hypothetical protein